MTSKYTHTEKPSQANFERRVPTSGNDAQHKQTIVSNYGSGEKYPEARDLPRPKGNDPANR